MNGHKKPPELGDVPLPFREAVYQDFEASCLLRNFTNLCNSLSSSESGSIHFHQYTTFFHYPPPAQDSELFTTSCQNLRTGPEPRDCSAVDVSRHRACSTHSQSWNTHGGNREPCKQVILWLPHSGLWCVRTHRETHTLNKWERKSEIFISVAA